MGTIASSARTKHGHKVAGHKVAAKSRTPEGKVREAKRVANLAITNAAAVATDTSRNRSTRTRASYKVKADALDHVLAVLTGKA